MPATLRRRIITSPIARPAVFPTRAMSVLRYDTRIVARSLDWLIRSGETMNIAYELGTTNRDQLGWFASAVTGAEIGQVRAWMRELEQDEELIEAMRRRLASNPSRRVCARRPHWARRFGWYAIIRAMQPEHVVEAGTYLGLGSCVIAAALMRNGHGRLTTIDIDPDAGHLITQPWASVIDSRTGSSVEVLPTLHDVGVFLHDSVITYDFETAELATVEPNLLPGAIVMSDNARSSPGVSALSDWAERTGRHYLYFKEQPRDHWWPGDGIGAAWAQVRAQ